MFPTPDHTLASLLRTLASTYPDNRTPVSSSAAGILKQIGTLGQPASLPYLLTWVHCPAKEAREAAEMAVGKLLPALNPREILALEAFFRESWSKVDTYGQSFFAHSLTACMLTTMAPSGRWREASLRQLLLSKDLNALPFVLLRINDWVPQVRAVAEKWLSLHLDRCTSKQLIFCAPILSALQDRQQARSSPWLSTLLSRLSVPESGSDLEEWLFHTDSRTRGLLFNLLSRTGSFDKPLFQEHLLKHQDPAFGMLLLKHFRQTNHALPDDVASMALKSKSALVQRYAWNCLTEGQLGCHHHLLMAALTSPAPGLRAFAQHHLRKGMPAETMRELYQKQALDSQFSSKRRIGAIHGFHETGGKWEPSVYDGLLMHKSTAIRAAAFRCFVQTRPENALPYAQRLLMAERSPLLARNALTALKHHPRDVTLRYLASLLDSGNDEIIRHRGFILLLAKSKWEKLPLLLALVRDSSRILQEKALIELGSWFNNFNCSPVQPSRQQLECAEQELQRSTPWLSPHMKLNLDSLLGSIKPV